MFFPRLRRRAKWVFLLLAIAFGLGFVAFGVGTGVSGTSLGDVIYDFLGQRSSSPEAQVDDAREKVRENPRNAAAQLELANALQTAGRTDEAIAALERYTQLRPRDADAVRQLAVLWGTKAATARNEAETLEARAQELTIADTLGAGQDSEFLREVSQNQISQSLATQVEEQASAARTRAQSASRQEAAAWRELTLLAPDDPDAWLQLGTASQGAGDLDAATAAYERFLELAPDDSRAELVRQQLEILKQFQGG